MPLADATQSVALLGPTNTGKTHRAVERMLEHESGMIGLPLRLLAREVYDRVSSRVGEDRVALVTGEEKRVPRRPDYWVCTTEAMPLTREVDFVAVDEVQLATHDERGHVFTDRLLHARGRRESWFMGSAAMHELMQRLVPAARHQQHPRLSRLTFAGSSKLQKLPPRSALVAFSIPELYRLAGRLRATRGGAAVVLGALSPRARNAQVAMFQAGEVDYLVATDAIGMGLNLQVSHVAFASLRKFDGQHARTLSEPELSQIAGRAGRYLHDGSFGTLAPLELPQDVAERIEQHAFEPVRRVRYRNSELDFSSSEALLAALEAPPPAAHLASVPTALDVASLRALLKDAEVAGRARRGPELELLWRVCEIPDFRHILFEVHVALLRELFLSLSEEPLSDAFLARHTAELGDRRGDVDALLARTARLRTWAFIANRAGWVAHAEAWREQLATLEDGLSDALHAGLVASFVERRGKTRVLPKRSLIAGASAEPELPSLVDPHHPFATLHKLKGRVHEPVPEPQPLSTWEELIDAPHEAFELSDSGAISYGDLKLAQLARGASLTQPEIRMASLDDVPAGTRNQLQRRLLAFARDVVSRLLEPLAPLRHSARSPLRAIAYQLERQLGSVRRRDLATTLGALSDADREALNQTVVEPGRLAVYIPQLLGPRALARRVTLLHTFEPSTKLPPVGRAVFDPQHLSERAWMTLGYVVLGRRAFRLDLAERVAALLSEGASEREALSCLALPKRDWAAVGGSFRSALEQASSPEQVDPTERSRSL
ncbi:MAG TPA: helicase-related protein [Polyangiaceae bacterium]|nr:helicase-related protein [Polyangiaceae bacterium]